MSSENPRYECLCVKCNKSFFAESKRALICLSCKAPSFPWHAQSNPAEVTPLNDLREHRIGLVCWCEPFIEDGVIVHNALDGRERLQ